LAAEWAVRAARVAYLLVLRDRALGIARKRFRMKELANWARAFESRARPRAGGREHARAQQHGH